MAKTILNIAKAYQNGLVANIEKNKYFELHKNATTRADLYSFAIAIAMKEGAEPSSPQNVETFVRTEYLEKYEPLFSCLFFEKKLKDNTDQIDDLCNRDDVYILAEKYANAGFSILNEWFENRDEETLFYELVSYMNKKYEDIKDEVNAML